MITVYVIQGKNGFVHVCACDFDLEGEKIEMGQLSQNVRLKKWISTDYF